VLRLSFSLFSLFPAARTFFFSLPLFVSARATPSRCMTDAVYWPTHSFVSLLSPPSSLLSTSFFFFSFFFPLRVVIEHFHGKECKTKALPKARARLSSPLLTPPPSPFSGSFPLPSPSCVAPAEFSRGTDGIAGVRTVSQAARAHVFLPFFFPFPSSLFFYDSSFFFPPSFPSLDVDLKGIEWRRRRRRESLATAATSPPFLSFLFLFHDVFFPLLPFLRGGTSELGKARRERLNAAGVFLSLLPPLLLFLSQFFFPLPSFADIEEKDVGRSVRAQKDPAVSLFSSFPLALSFSPLPSSPEIARKPARASTRLTSFDSIGFLSPPSSFFPPSRCALSFPMRRRAAKTRSLAGALLLPFFFPSVSFLFPLPRGMGAKGAAGRSGGSRVCPAFFLFSFSSPRFFLFSPLFPFLGHLSGTAMTLSLQNRGVESFSPLFFLRDLFPPFPPAALVP